MLKSIDSYKTKKCKNVSLVLINWKYYYAGCCADPLLWHDSLLKINGFLVQHIEDISVSQTQLTPGQVFSWCQWLLFLFNNSRRKIYNLLSNSTLSLQTQLNFSLVGRSTSWPCRPKPYLLLDNTTSTIGRYHVYPWPSSSFYQKKRPYMFEIWWLSCKCLTGVCRVSGGFLRGI